MNVSRREAYLLVWGVGYFVLGVLFSESSSPSSNLFRLLFIGAGTLAAMGSMTQRLFMDRLAFAALAGAATARGIWHFTDGESSTLLAGILWVAVAIAQLIVAGWPDVGNNDVELPK